MLHTIKRGAGLVAGYIRREGVGPTLAKTNEIVRRRVNGWRASRQNPEKSTYVDVLFVNGCAPSVPHPTRYRVDHQIQQLEAVGVSCARVNAWELRTEMAGDARNIVIFRCPYTDEVGAFIEQAKKLNKRVYYDVDDLVIDTCYTDQISYVKALSPDERALYDDGVLRMGRTLKLCDAAITSTERLATELAHYVPDVFVNRNVASEEMVHYSDRALYERDDMPLLRESDVSAQERKHWETCCAKAEARRNRGPVIGYFSGSITHNSDFELVLPALARIMAERPTVRLAVVGELTVPEGLAPYADRIDALPFCDWKDLPGRIADVDINIAPLENTIFNEAKSENKWVEAALVKVPTVASNVGAFAKMIEDGVTGLLCDDADAWYAALARLLDDPEYARGIADAAYAWCRTHAVTVGTGVPLANYLCDHQTPNVAFSIPGLTLSGGVLVICHHAAILQRQGIDVTFFDGSGKQDIEPWFEFAGQRIPVRRPCSAINRDVKILPHARIDLGVATMWSTLQFLLEYPNIGRIGYLVQGYETDFYKPTDPCRALASRTYNRSDIEYLTVSGWCANWLKDRWGHEARYAPNGIVRSMFAPGERDWGGKVRILIEGDSSSPYKNVDEAFRVANRLDPERYEIWYMSYNAGPKAEYRVDRFLHKVPHEQVADVYRQCHILLKTSILESFSYPPLEMMATGGAVVVVPNDGNVEYIEDGVNCLTYERGDIDAALACIERITGEADLRERLRAGGLATADRRDWGLISDQVVELYR